MNNTQDLKKYLISLSFLFFFLTFSSHAQVSRILIKGQLVFGIKPIANAVVFVKLNKDTTNVITSDVTDSTGIFKLKFKKPSHYPVQAFIIVQRISFKREKKKVIITSKTGSEIDLGVIYLQLKNNSLPQIAVSAAPDFINRKGSTLIYEISNNPKFKAMSINQVLSQLPGVQILPDGTLKVLGDSNVTVLINGNNEHLNSVELQNLLKSFTAEIVQSIEISINPSAKYAASRGKIININLRKKIKGIYTTSSLNTTKGIGPRFRASNYTLYHTPNFRASLSSNYGNIRNYEFSDLNRTLQTSSGIHLFEHNKFKIVDKSVMLLGNASYQLTPRFQLGAAIKYYLVNETIPRIGISKYRFPLSETADSLIHTNNLSNNNRNDLFFGINGNWYVGRDSTLVNFRYNIGRYHIHSFQKNRYLYTFKTQPLTTEKTRFSSDSRIKFNFNIFKVDIYPRFLPNLNLTVGGKLSAINYSDKLSFNLQSGVSKEIKNLLNSDHYMYDENNLGIYISSHPKIKKWDLQIGLRMEHTHLNNKIKNLGVPLIDSTYVHFFPSLSIFRTIALNHEIGFNFTRRIQRPSYKNLNPSVFLLDPTTYLKGNISLRPQLKNIYQFVYIFKSNYLISFSYNYTSEFIIQTPIQKENILKLQPFNFDKKKAFRIYLSIPLQINQWWDLRSEWSWQKGIYHNYFKTQKVINKYTSWNITLHNDILLPANLRLNVNGFFQGPTTNGLYHQKYYYLISANLSKSFLSDRLNFGLYFHDIFSSYNIKNNINDLGQHLLIKQKFDSQYLSFRISFSFHRGGKTKHKQHGFNETEIKRANL